MATEPKQDNKQLDIKDVKQISLVDIEELRRTLGAESDINLDDLSVKASNCIKGVSTCMCPSW